MRSMEAAVGTGTLANPGAPVRLTLTDPLGRVTRFATDAYGQPTRIENALGGVTLVVRDPRLPGNMLLTDAPGGGGTSGAERGW